VKQKENIFEELGRMKSLIHAKAGTVISEQATNVGSDVGTVMRELDAFNTNEQKIVDIVKKYNDKASFKNFLDQYKSISGQDFGLDIHRAINTSQGDTNEVKAITDHLAKLGITFKLAVKNGKSQYEISGLDTPATAPAAGTRTPEAMKNITSTFCGVRGGKITAGAFKDQPWTKYKETYKVTDAEEQEAKKSCPTVQVGSGSGQRSGQSSVNNRFASSVKSLGIQGDKMDLQTLQSILNTLEGGQSTAAATGTPAAATTGTPDIAQLTAALNQLQA
jgi:hypothetical protein